jgi:predicted lipoprotein with Yx(FWY)xxD motif
MKRFQLLLVVSSMAVLGVTVTASGQSARSSAAHTVVTTKQTSLGTILVTSSGQTLYLDVGDKPGHFACTGMCAAAWPALSTSGKPKAAGKAKASYLGTVKHGTLTQVTYKGHPMYTFTADTSSSPISGQGVNGFYVVSPGGKRITKAAKTTTSTTTTSTTSTTSTSPTTTTTPTTTSSTSTTTSTTTTSTTSTSTTSTSTTSSGYPY